MVSIPVANELLRELHDAVIVLRELGHDDLANCLSWRAGLLTEALAQTEESEASPLAANTRSEFWLG